MKNDNSVNTSVHHHPAGHLWANSVTSKALNSVLSCFVIWVNGWLLKPPNFMEILRCSMCDNITSTDANCSKTNISRKLQSYWILIMTSDKWTISRGFWVSPPEESGALTQGNCDVCAIHFRSGYICFWQYFVKYEHIGLESCFSVVSDNISSLDQYFREYLPHDISSKDYYIRMSLKWNWQLLKFSGGNHLMPLKKDPWICLIW